MQEVPHLEVGKHVAAILCDAGEHHVALAELDPLKDLQGTCVWASRHTGSSGSFTAASSHVGAPCYRCSTWAPPIEPSSCTLEHHNCRKKHVRGLAILSKRLPAHCISTTELPTCKQHRSASTCQAAQHPAHLTPGRGGADQHSNVVRGAVQQPCQGIIWPLQGLLLVNGCLIPGQEE